MKLSQLRSALRSGQRVYGTLITSESPRFPAQVAQIGLDFIFIDTEHIALDRKILSWMCQAYGAMGLPAIVRIPSPDPYTATMVLDGGAAGVVVPYVETVEQVRALRGAVKLRPLKGARLQAALEGKLQLEPEMRAYQQARYTDNLMIINIESRPAMENLDALLAVEDLDGILIGPHDLSCSLGIPEEYDSPVFDAAVRHIVQRARARGVGAGIHYWKGTRNQIAWAQAGMNMIIQSADVTAMRDKLTADVGELRRALGDERRAGDGADEAI